MVSVDYILYENTRDGDRSSKLHCLIKISNIWLALGHTSALVILKIAHNSWSAVTVIKSRTPDTELEVHCKTVHLIENLEFDIMLMYVVACFILVGQRWRIIIYLIFNSIRQ